MANIRFTHVNIIAEDWRGLSRFYRVVFGGVPVPPVRKLSGVWLEAATGASGAIIEGEHLRLPGYDENGPTLEIFSYKSKLDRPPPAANRLGIGHIAFEVEDVHATLDRVLTEGGSALGQVQSADVPGKGKLTFVYAKDPESNIIELQAWG